jgi:hypothetical protein
MRDPERIERIERICTALAECWSEFPDLRLGQLITNINCVYKNQDIFFIEDNTWLELIHKFNNEYKK